MITTKDEYTAGYHTYFIYLNDRRSKNEKERLFDPYASYHWNRGWFDAQTSQGLKP